MCTKVVLLASVLILSLKHAYAWENEQPEQAVEYFTAGELSNNELELYRGTAGFTQDIGETIVALNNSANVTGNVISGTAIGGTNMISDNAFNAATGINIVIQNSGPLSTIQTNTLVNLYMQN